MRSILILTLMLTLASAAKAVYKKVTFIEDSPQHASLLFKSPKADMQTLSVVHANGKALREFEVKHRVCTSDEAQLFMAITSSGTILMVEVTTTTFIISEAQVFRQEILPTGMDNVLDRE